MSVWLHKATKSVSWQGPLPTQVVTQWLVEDEGADGGTGRATVRAGAGGAEGALKLAQGRLDVLEACNQGRGGAQAGEGGQV